MKVIQHYIHEHKRSSIIVSHDINLSVEFADQIIVLIKDGEVGEILQKNIFHSILENGSKLWLNSEGHQIKDFPRYLQKELL